MSNSAIPYWHVDAFASRPFTGNQAAVMILERWPDDAVLVAIGAENNFAETAFLVRDETGVADWQLRWFTPTCEIRLCGHATLASGHVLLAQSGEERVTFRTRLAGVMEVCRQKGGGYEVALPAIRTMREPYPEAVKLLGATPLEVWRNPDDYALFLYENEAQVRALEPDFNGLAELGHDSFTCTAPGITSDIVSRVFVPGAGVDEDAVTGSAHAVLAPFWSERLGRGSFTAHQASARGGNLACRIEGERVWLGGDCVTIVEGRFYLPA